MWSATSVLSVLGVYYVQKCKKIIMKNRNFLSLHENTFLDHRRIKGTIQKKKWKRKIKRREENGSDTYHNNTKYLDR